MRFASITLYPEPLDAKTPPAALIAFIDEVNKTLTDELRGKWGFDCGQVPDSLVAFALDQAVRDHVFDPDSKKRWEPRSVSDRPWQYVGDLHVGVRALVKPGTDNDRWTLKATVEEKTYQAYVMARYTIYKGCNLP